MMSHSEQLKQIIESTLLQIIQPRVSYVDEILIQGTLGIIADKQTVVLLHFSNNSQQIPSMDITQKNNDASVYMPTTVSSESSQMNSTSQDTTTVTSSQLSGAEALFTLNDFADKTLGRDTLSDTSDPNKMPLEFGDSIPINIDSDSDSFSLTFGDYDVQTNKTLTETDDFKDVDLITDDKNLNCLGMQDDDNLAIGTEVSVLSNDTQPQRRYGIASKNLRAMEKEASSNSFSYSSSPEKKTVRAIQRKPSVCICEVCGREFTNNGHLEAHLVSAHDVTETKTLGRITHFQCPHCPQKYRYQAVLDKHLNKHQNTGAEKSHRCRFCRQAYRFKESLSIHQSVHKAEQAGEKNFDCDICDKRYSRKELLQKHIVYKHENRQNTAKKRRHDDSDDDDDR